MVASGSRAVVATPLESRESTKEVGDYRWSIGEQAYGRFTEAISR
jgi:hypothetical protein